MVKYIEKTLMILCVLVIGVVLISGCVQEKAPTKPEATVTQTPTEIPTMQPTTAVSPTPAFVLQKVEETDTSFVWAGQWEPEQNPGASGGTWKKSTITGAKVDITFTATGIAVFYPKLPGNGIASIKIDGVPYPDIEMYSQTPTLDKKVITTNLTNAKHVLTIAHTGKRNPAADSQYIIIDAVELTIPS